MKIFLVYGECECGWRCACGEGAEWPKCPVCGQQVMPPKPRGDIPRMGLVAELLPEQEALQAADASLAPWGDRLTLSPFPWQAGGALRIYHPDREPL